MIVRPMTSAAPATAAVAVEAATSRIPGAVPFPPLGDSERTTVGGASILTISGGGTDDESDLAMGAVVVVAVVVVVEEAGISTGTGVAGLTSSIYVAGNRPSSPFVFRP